MYSNTYLSINLNPPYIPLAILIEKEIIANTNAVVAIMNKINITIKIAKQ